MVVPLGPGKFYGTSLPRPRIYTDIKFNDHRVDPPVPVTDPFMSWAHEAHWSMGGLGLKRLRLQGKIEGNVDKLRAQRRNHSNNQGPSPSSLPRSDLTSSKRSPSLSPPPPPPVAAKRRRFLDLIDEEEEEEEEEETVKRGVRRRLVKKLGADFDRVASDASPLKGSGDGSDSMALRTRSRRLEKGDAVRKVVEGEVNISRSKGKKSKSEGDKSSVSVSVNGVRTSPRLAKRGSN